MNYYLVKNGPTTKEPIHIGKSSFGWMFLFHAINAPYEEPPIVWNSIKQVRETLKKMTVDSPDYVIIDEEDNVVSFREFFEIVELKQMRGKDNPDNFTYARNVDGYRFTEGWFR
jgi:hypothetical protein